MLGIATESRAALVATALLGCGLSEALSERLCADPRPADAGHRPPVLLVHGLWSNRSWCLRLRRELHAAGWSTHALNYRTVGASIEQAGREVAGAVRALAESRDGGRVHVVAHSLGGIVLREAVSRHGVADLISAAVTLGSPHRGAPLAGTIARLPLHPAIAQVAPGSAYLRGLDADTRATPALAWHALYSTDDQVVPGTAGRLDHPLLNAQNHVLNGLGHVGLTVHGRAVAQVLRSLTAAERPAELRSVLAGEHSNRPTAGRIHRHPVAVREHLHTLSA
jgi:triacylglycerol lipase